LIQYGHKEVTATAEINELRELDIPGKISDSAREHFRTMGRVKQCSLSTTSLKEEK
jgi:hypothetical protein